jgi:pimeloyl-ACP methyl ester carboxylesterase
MSTPTPVILVHGFWHSGWCWSLVTEELAGRAIASVAVDLDGHGLRSRLPESRRRRPFDPGGYAAEVSPVADVTASSAAASLVEQLRRIGRGRPCLVVAHSMGGVVATAAAEQAPDLFSELLYVAAFAPVSGIPAAAYISSPENAGEVISAQLVNDPAAIGALRLDPDGADQQDRIREIFYHDVDRATADAAIALLGSEGPAGIVGEPLTITPERYGSVPHSYVVCGQDKVVPPPLQRRFVKEIDAVSAAPTRVVELDSSHSPFLSRPTLVADVIESAYAVSSRP